MVDWHKIVAAKELNFKANKVLKKHWN